MPVHVEKKGNKWVVVSDATGKVEAEANTKRDAEINASYKNKAAGKKKK